jgi:hypothetical protein
LSFKIRERATLEKSVLYREALKIKLAQNGKAYLYSHVTSFRGMGPESSPLEIIDGVGNDL